jgi:hypothetical protein
MVLQDAGQQRADGLIDRAEPMVAEAGRAVWRAWQGYGNNGRS